jgi:hypothetical protein
MMALVGSGTLVALAAFSIAALGVGHWLGGPEPEHRTVLALATATRHPAIAIAIATANIAEPSPVMAAVLLYLVVSVLMAIPYIKKHTDHGAGMGGPVTVREPLTASPGKARCSPTGMASRAAPRGAPRSSPGSRQSEPG